MCHCRSFGLFHGQCYRSRAATSPASPNATMNLTINKPTTGATSTSSRAPTVWLRLHRKDPPGTWQAQAQTSMGAVSANGSKSFRRINEATSRRRIDPAREQFEGDAHFWENHL